MDQFDSVIGGASQQNQQQSKEKHRPGPLQTGLVRLLPGYDKSPTLVEKKKTKTMEGSTSSKTNKSIVNTLKTIVGLGVAKQAPKMPGEVYVVNADG